MKQFILFCLLLAGKHIFAQTEFLNGYGGPENEGFQCLVQLPDSDFILLGSTRSYGPGNVNNYLVRTNRFGDTLWTRVFGDGNRSASKLLLQNNNRILVLSNAPCTLEKFDLNGNLIFSRQFGESDPVQGTCISEMNDGSYLIYGYEIFQNQPYTDLALFKVDSTGNLQWMKFYGDSLWEYPGTILHSEWGGFYITGTTSSYNNAANFARDAFLARLDNNGDTLWWKRYSVPLYMSGFAKIIQLDDGGLALAGSSNYNATGMNDILLIRTDSLGDTLWTKLYGGLLDDAANSLLRMPDNGFLLTGHSGSFNSTQSNFDVFLIRTDSLGDTLWSRNIGSYDNDWFSDAIMTHTNQLAIAGTSNSWSLNTIGPNSDGYLLTTDTALHFSCFESPAQNITIGRCPLAVYSFSTGKRSGGIQLASGPTILGGGSITNWCNPQAVQSPLPESEWKVYPQPTDQFVNIQFPGNEAGLLFVFDTQGRFIQKQNTFSSELKLETAGWPAGLYLLSWISESGNKFSQRVLVLHP